MASFNLNLGLPATPKLEDEKNFNEFLRIYHAIEKVAGYASSLGNLIAGDLTPRITKVLAVDLLPAFRVVTSNGRLANSTTIAHSTKVVGITLQAIPIGFRNEVVDFGTITNPAWTWATGDTLYLNGTAISTVAPASGFSQEIGLATGATTVAVLLGPPVLL